MSRVLFAYSTTDGHTRRICEHLRDALCAQGHDVDLASMAEAGERDLAAYDKIVLGASIRYGRHKPEVTSFARAHRAELGARPSAFFTVSIVARKPGKDRPETNPYLRKFLRRLPWQPRELDVFAGRLDYPSLGMLDRSIIRFIMWLTRGPTIRPLWSSSPTGSGSRRSAGGWRRCSRDPAARPSGAMAERRHSRPGSSHEGEASHGRRGNRTRRRAFGARSAWRCAPPRRAEGERTATAARARSRAFARTRHPRPTKTWRATS